MAEEHMIDEGPLDRESRELSRRIRRHALTMVHRARASHIGSCLSCADILAVLYASVLRIDPHHPKAPHRDRFVLSKGHAAAILYAVLAERGFFPTEWLDRYGEDGCPLAGHAVHRGVPGVEVSTGSLGHGLSLGAGMALAVRDDPARYAVFVLLSDGECDEGSIWEAALFAAHQRLSNLVAIVDRNQLQGFGRTAEVLELEPFADKWRAFGWRVEEVDGHDHSALRHRLNGARLAADCTERNRAKAERPLILIAHTTKGKGVPFMQAELAWHYRSPNSTELAESLKAVEAELLGAREAESLKAVEVESLRAPENEDGK